MTAVPEPDVTKVPAKATLSASRTSPGAAGSFPDRALEGLGLAGQTRVVHHEPLGLDDPDVGGHPVSFPDQHDVTSDQRLGGDLVLATLAQHQGPLGKERAQRLGGPLSPVLLEEAEAPVHQHDDSDRPTQLR